MLREKFLGQPADLDVVTAQAGKVFDKYRGGPPLLKLLDHLHKSRAVHRDAGNAIVQEMDQIGVAFLFRHFGQQLFLRRDLSRSVFAKQCAIRIDKQQKERYNNVVIDNDVIILAQRSEDMANRDHSLDDGIIQAAYSEFLAYGFQKASLHKIAEKAGVTTGAIYTRYKNKDALFASLLQDFFETMQVLFAPIAEEYEKAKCSAQPDDILRAINAEEQVYFQLLTEHCNDCTLFFCRSDGSSMETVLHKLMDQKAEQTVEFFSHIYGKAPNADAIRLLMGSQFWYFRQLLDQHMEEGRMLTCLQAVLDFTNAGWRQLCDTLQ